MSSKIIVNLRILCESFESEIDLTLRVSKRESKSQLILNKSQLISN